jgi:hypothetical protein
MDFWGTKVSQSFRQQCQHLLGIFFRDLEKSGPWFVSVGNPVDGVPSSCLTFLLGFHHEEGINFLCSLGLLKRGHSRSPDAISVVQKAWDRFVDEELLGDIMEYITKTTVGDTLHYFIHYGKKSLLKHIPIEQFNGDVTQPIKAISNLKRRQSQFHQSLSKLLETATLTNSILNKQACMQSDMQEKEGGEESSSDEEVQESFDFGESVILSATDTPCLVKSFGGEYKVSRGHLNMLLLELLKVLGNNATASIDFEYKNGNKGRAVIIPSVKNEESFRRQAKRTKWIESCLDHISEKNDAAQWLSYYLGDKYKGSFSHALEALGIPIVQRLDEQSTAAMWTDANINYTQQRIIKRHLRLHFGKRLFIPDSTFSSDHEHYYIPTYYNEYRYYKNGDKTQQPERCHYWCRDPSLVVANEISRMLDYTEPNIINSTFSSLLSSGTCSLIAGADQGQGAWRSWVKIPKMSGEQVRLRMASEEDFDIKSTYVIAQVAHITCKKDHHEILSNTVSQRISEGYEKLLSHRMIFVKPSYDDAKVKAVMISKDATNIMLISDANDAEKCHITYQVSGSGFTMVQCDDTRFPAGSKIVLAMPPFGIFITGDLAFYADVLGMPNSSSYWCPWCLLSHPEWNKDTSTVTAEQRTIKFLSDTVQAIKRDTKKQLKPIDRKGVTSERHYSCLGPENFVPPLLHIEIGMVNQAWVAFEEWVDDVVEVVPPNEKEARKQLADAIEKVAQAAEEKKQSDATINVELREKSSAATLIKAQLRRKNLGNEQRQDLTVQLALLDTFITELKQQIKAHKDNLKKCNAHLSESKQKLATCREERGKPEASISAEIETVLEKYKASRAAYHGGDYNGVSCRRIVGNCSKITEELHGILQAKKNETCSTVTVDEQIKQLELTLGLLDAAFYYLNIPHPNDDEKKKAKDAVEALSKQWREVGLSVTLKAHVMEKHVVPFNDKYGLGDKEESFIELGHQIGIKDNRRYQGMTNFQKKMKQP